MVFKKSKRTGEGRLQRAVFPLLLIAMQLSSIGTISSAYPSTSSVLDTGTAKRMQRLQKVKATVLNHVKWLPLSSISPAETWQKLGNGAFGTVYKAELEGRSVALKAVNFEQVKSRFNLDDGGFLEILQWEIACLSTVSHPNLVQFCGVYETPEAIYLVTEYCERGDLLNILTKDTFVSWALRWKWSLESAQGLAALHNQKLIHRDLKVDNILVDHNGRACLTDLGVAQIDDHSRLEQPELVARGSQSKRFKSPEGIVHWAKSTKKGDVYAFGLVLWQIATRGGNPGFSWGWMRRSIKEQWKNAQLEFLPDAKTLWDVLDKADDTENPIPESCQAAFEKHLLPLLENSERVSMPADCPCPGPFKDLISDCLKIDPAKRPAPADVAARLLRMGKDGQIPDLLPETVHLLDFLQNLYMSTSHSDVTWRHYASPYVTDFLPGEDSVSLWKQSLETGKALLNLHDTFRNFLQDPSVSTLVLSGESGVGKSTSLIAIVERLLLEVSDYSFLPVRISGHSNTSVISYKYLERTCHIQVRSATPVKFF